MKYYYVVFNKEDNPNAKHFFLVDMPEDFFDFERMSELLGKNIGILYFTELSVREAISYQITYPAVLSAAL